MWREGEEEAERSSEKEEDIERKGNELMKNEIEGDEKET